MSDDTIEKLNKDQDKAAIDQVLKVLNESVDSLDMQSRERLNQARQQALDSLDSLDPPWYAQFMLPVGSVVIAGSLLFAIVIVPNTEINRQLAPPVGLANNAVIDADQIALLAEDIDLLADLEMLQWFGDMAEIYEEAG